MKTIIIGGLTLVAVPTTIYGYAMNNADIVDGAASIVEVASVAEDTVDTTKATETPVDSNIADILNIETASADNDRTTIGEEMIAENINAYMSGLKDSTDNISKAISETKNQTKTTQKLAESNSTDNKKETTTEVESTAVETESVEQVEEYVEPVVVEVAPAEPVREYVVYKASTHYVHKNTCRWADGSCYEIESTEGLEARRCTECNADIEIINEYFEPVPETNVGYVDDYDRQLLAEIVWHEAGSSWITQYNKAKIAAGVMNRVYDSRFPDTVYGVLTAPKQFSGYWPGCCTPTQECYDAVDYYFAHPEEFNGDNSWYGDGRQNHFYCI